MKPFPLLLIAALALTGCVSSPQEKDLREKADDIADARQRADEDAGKYKAYLEEYARQLGKKPSQLTKEELQWVRAHYNN